MDGVQISCEVVCVFAMHGFMSTRRRTFWWKLFRKSTEPCGTTYIYSHHGSDKPPCLHKIHKRKKIQVPKNYQYTCFISFMLCLMWLSCHIVNHCIPQACYTMKAAYA